MPRVVRKKKPLVPTQRTGCRLQKATRSADDVAVMARRLRVAAIVLWCAEGLVQPRLRQRRRLFAEQESRGLLTAGNGAYLQGHLDEAFSLYTSCVEAGEFPWACDCAVNLASVVLDRDGDLDKAEQWYRRALDAAEKGAWGASAGQAYFHVDAAHNLASLLQTRADDAHKIEDRRRLLYEAAVAYKSVVLADDSRWDAWANLGSAMLDAEGPKLDAVRCLQKAILKAEQVEEAYEASADGRLGSVRHALATAYYGLGSALGHLSEDEVKLAARSPDILLLEENASDQARIVADTAANALRSAMRLAGGDMKLRAKAEHGLAAVEHDARRTRASPTFVRALFDDFAATFDDQLVQDLNYKVPEIVAERAAARRPDGYELALDAGCGTGLLGVAGLAVAKLVGADVSAKMCQVARDRRWPDGTNVYDAVVEGDLLDPSLYDRLALDDQPDLVAAADVLCYFGDLQPLFDLWLRVLKPDGDLLFTVETLHPDSEHADLDWELAASGRYAHATTYVKAAAAKAGFETLDAQPVVARLERGKPVDATLFLLHKPGRPADAPPDVSSSTDSPGSP